MPFPKSIRQAGTRYVIVAVESVTKWEKVEPVEPCTKEVAAKFIFETIIVMFGYPPTLISDSGTQFINQTIELPLKEFMINHHKSSAYHPKSNGAIESFNKTLIKGLTKKYNIDIENCDDKVPPILWAYRTTYK